MRRAVSEMPILHQRDVANVNTGSDGGSRNPREYRNVVEEAIPGLSRTYFTRFL
jgi:hypothetical protein